MELPQRADKRATAKEMARMVLQRRRWDDELEEAETLEDTEKSVCLERRADVSDGVTSSRLLASSSEAMMSDSIAITDPITLHGVLGAMKG